jgi:monofunctional biosynthetic peptidoglycan transglycosylase
VLAPSPPRGQASAMSGARRAPTWRSLLWRWLVRAACAVCLFLALLMALWRFLPPSSTLMLARWATLRPVDRAYEPLDRISPFLQTAVVTSEDERFCLHHGVDWGALSGVLDDAAGGLPNRGASTIPMQTVKNLFLWPSRSVARKAIEIPLALMLDLVWPKRRILEVYLNIAQWGDGVFGAESAARFYFHKHASALTRREADLLATSLPNPLLRNPARPRRLQNLLAQRLAARARQAAPFLACFSK